MLKIKNSYIQTNLLTLFGILAVGFVMKGGHGGKGGVRSAESVFEVLFRFYALNRYDGSY